MRAHSIVRDSLFLPNKEILQSAQHLVPDAIQLSDLASARSTVMLQWKNGTLTGKKSTGARPVDISLLDHD